MEKRLKLETNSNFMFFLNDIKFIPKSNAEHFVGAKSVSEYAYYDDMNSSARMTMEDGTDEIFLKIFLYIYMYMYMYMYKKKT